MPASRSTPRLRLTVALLAGTVALVAVSERPLAGSLAGEALSLLGFACMTVAALGRVWTSLFIAGFKDTQLVRGGPYAALRHPLYALSLLAMVGVGLVTRSLLLACALAVVFGLLLAAAARREDAWLCAAHGPDFDRYRREVRAFLPRGSVLAAPPSLEVRPRMLARAFLDAGTLLGLYALLRLADALQRAGVTPTLLALP
jgi:protein-S-isoprenylcysteine O-methyltransferase Ste14